MAGSMVEKFVARPQYFSIPPSFIYYVAKIPKTSSSIYYKLYYCSKYFYNKLKILPCYHINFSQYVMQLYSRGCRPSDSKVLNITLQTALSCNFKLFCMGYLEIRNYILQLSSLISRHHFMPNHLTIYDQTLTLEEWKKITKKTKYFKMFRSKVLYLNGNIVPVEEILKSVPDIICFGYFPQIEETGHYTSETASKLENLERKKKIHEFSLKFVPNDFDAQKFAAFILKNSAQDDNSSDYSIMFRGDTTADFRENFSNIIRMAIKSWKHKAIIRLSWGMI